MRNRSTIFRLYFFFLTFLLAVSLGRSLLSFWYIQNGLDYKQIVLYFLIDFLMPPLILLFVRKFSTQRSFIIALLSEILLMLNVSHFYHPFQIYLAGALAGTTVLFFYLTYNTLFFENTPRDKRATSSSLYILPGPVLSIIIPLLTGFIGQTWGLPKVFLASIVVLFFVFYLVRFLPKIEFECNLFDNLKKTQRINLLLLIEGIKDSIPLVALPVFVLFFIRQPLPYGAYFSYLAVVSTATTFLLGFLSDKFKKRTFILYPTTTLLAIGAVCLGFAHDLAHWAIISGFLSLISTINGIFVTTLVLDQIREVKTGMISREFLLGVGRVIGVSIIFVFLSFYSSPKIAIILIGLLYLAFPLTLYLRKIYKTDN